MKRKSGFFFLKEMKGMKPYNILLFLSIAAVTFFFHFYNLGYSELSNDETEAVIYSAYLAHGIDHPFLLGSLFIFSHPPVRILVNIPFMLLFGASETVMRFPHALFGALAIIPLYLIGERLYGKKEAMLACLFYAVSGVSAINNESQGVGIYLFFVLLALYYLVLFLNDKEPERESSHLLRASISLIIATYTYLEAVVFVLPILYFVIRKKGFSAWKEQTIRRAAMVYLAGVLVYFTFWWLMPNVAHRLGYINKSSGGNVFHIFDRFSELGSFNGLLILKQYIEYNSFFSVFLLILGITAGAYLLRKEEGFFVNSLYLLPHIFAWTFILRNIVMHPMYDFPLVALLAAAGLIKLLDILKNRAQLLRQGLMVTIALCLLLSAWHHYVAHNQDSLEFSSDNFVFGQTTNRPIRLGSKAAGYYIRTHSEDVTENVFDGNGAISFYSGRLEKNRDLYNLLEEASEANNQTILSESPDWPNVRYVVIKDNHELWDYAQTHFLLEAVVTLKEQPVLYIFNALQPPSRTAPELIVSEQYETQYDNTFTHWRQVAPWFLLRIQKRL